MLRIIPSYAADGAKRYFDDALSRGDYYMEGQEIAGQWGGKAAAMLGLAGDVTRDAFHKLCDNIRPDTGERLTARTKEGRRVGYDVNINAPKKLSVLYEITRDERILNAFRTAVRETMRDIERDMHCRVRDNGQDSDRRTGNMLWAEFVHFTARPVDGVPDPALHAHCFSFNATFDDQYRNRDGSSGMWKAGQFGQIKRDARYFEAAVHSRLSGAMARFGYEVERDSKGFWDMKLPDSIREKFSGRTKEVEAASRAKGITDPKQKAELAAKTRGTKEHGLTRADLRHKWDGRLTDDERSAIWRSAEDADGTPRIPDVGTQQALDYSEQHLFERKSAVPTRQLAEYGLRRGFGSVSVADVWRGVGERKAEGSVLDGEIEDREFCTTPEVLAEEWAMIAFAREGRGTCGRLGREDYRFKDPLFTDPAKDTAEQRRAIREVLGSRDRVIAVRGRAGTGKTTMMREVVAGINDVGREVHAFAPTARASRGVMRLEGFARADTVARLLQDRKLQQRVEGQVIWVDEAGLLGARAMNQVFELADRQNCRVILSGDTRQHSAVERGDALRVLEGRGGVLPIEITKVQRQRVQSGREPDEIRQYRQAVMALSEGDPAKAFDRLERMGAVTIFDIDVEPSRRHGQIAEDYLAAIGERNLKGKPKSVLVVSPTHVEADAVTKHIREGLRRAGKIGGRDREITRLVNLNLTEAQRSDAAVYRPGMVIQFNQNAPGFGRGGRYGVVERGERSDLAAPGGEACAAPERKSTQVIIQAEDGKSHTLPLHLASRFTVYEERNLALANGDRIRITQNGFTADNNHRLNNGAIYATMGLTREGNIRLSNGWEISQSYGHIAHGYCTTSHAAQGKTVDDVLIAQSGTSFPASSIEQFYVSVSRGRERVRIYTDDKEGLREAIERSGKRVSASEIADARADDARRQKERRQRIAKSVKRVNRRQEVIHGKSRRDRRPGKPDRGDTHEPLW